LEAASETTTQQPKRRHRRRALWLGLFVVLAVVGGRWVWLQVQFTRLRVPLIQAVKEGDAAHVRDLLDQGADPNVRMDYQPEPFTWSHIFDILRGKTTNDSQEATVLMEVSQRDRRDIVRLLLEHGAAVNKRANQGTSLHVAAHTGALDTMKELLAHGADIRAQDTDGRTSLFYAMEGDQARRVHLARQEATNCVGLLLQQGADIDARAKNGETPLMEASYYPSSFRQLMARGADVNARDETGRTALMCAATSGTLETVRELLDARAEVNRQEWDGSTALHHAVETRGHRGATDSGRVDSLRIIKLLLTKGADVRLKSTTWGTAEQFAERFYDPEVVALLRKAAARASGAGKGGL
jgi:ankyrin repeat protein